MPIAPSSADQWMWLPVSFARVFSEPLGAMGVDESGMETAQAVAGIIAFAAGCAWMFRARSLRLALLLAPLLLVLVASALRLYPFGGTAQTGGRVLIFLIPSFVFLMAEGAEQVRLRAGRVLGSVAAIALVGLMLIPSLTYAAVIVPQIRSETKPLLEYANENRAPGDLLYVYYNSRSSLDYYGPRYGWDRSNTVYGVCSRLQPAAYLPDLARLRGHARVWFLFVDTTGPGGYNERGLMLSFLDFIGKRLDDRVSTGVSLFLYDLREMNTSPGRFSVQIPRFSDTMISMSCRGPWGPK